MNSVLDLVLDFPASCLDTVSLSLCLLLILSPQAVTMQILLPNPLYPPSVFLCLLLSPSYSSLQPQPRCCQLRGSLILGQIPGSVPHSPPFASPTPAPVRHTPHYDDLWSSLQTCCCLAQSKQLMDAAVIVIVKSSLSSFALANSWCLLSS